MPLFDIAGHSGVDVQFYCNPLFETACCMHLLDAPSHHLHNKQLTRRLIKKAEGALLAKINGLSRLTYNWTLMMDLISTISYPAGADFYDMLACMNDLSPKEYTYFLFSGNKISLKTYTEWMKAPALIYQADNKNLPVYVDRDEAYRYLTDMPGTRAQIADVIAETWETCLKDEWPALSRQMQAQADAEQKLLKASGVSALVNSINPNLTYQNGKFIYSNLEDYPVYNFPFFKSFDRLYIFHSFFSAPHFYFNHHDDFLVIGCNILQDELRDFEVPPEMVRGLKALEDETRLRITLTLCRTPMTTQKLSEALGITPGAVSKHLKLLKAAGFLTSRKEKQEVFYQTLPNAVYELCHALRSMVKDFMN